MMQAQLIHLVIYLFIHWGVIIDSHTAFFAVRSSLAVHHSISHHSALNVPLFQWEVFVSSHFPLVLSRLHGILPLILFTRFAVAAEVEGCFRFISKDYFVL